MESSCSRRRAVVHLVGIIKEMPGTRYVEAHEQTPPRAPLAASRAGVSRIVYLSILGSAPRLHEDCQASKGRVETLPSTSGASRLR